MFDSIQNILKMVIENLNAHRGLDCSYIFIVIQDNILCEFPVLHSKFKLKNDRQLKNGFNLEGKGENGKYL